jgi:flagellin FlaB
MRTLRLKNKKGFTGIETAIIVIAFVIAASVFAFAILNMGLLTTSKAQQAIVSGVGNAQSAMKVSTVYALGDTATGNATALVLVIQPSGTGSTDFNQTKMTISYGNDEVSYASVYTMTDPNTSNPDQFINATTFGRLYDSSFTNYLANGIGTNCSAVIELRGNGNTLLEQGEAFAVFLDLTNINATNGPLLPYATFSIEVDPSQGAKLTYSDAMPSAIEPVMILSGS